MAKYKWTPTAHAKKAHGKARNLWGILFREGQPVEITGEIVARLGVSFTAEKLEAKLHALGKEFTEVPPSMKAEPAALAPKPKAPVRLDEDEALDSDFEDEAPAPKKPAETSTNSGA